MNMASLDKLLGLFATPQENWHQKQRPVRSDRNSTIVLEDFAQLGCREERLAGETFPAFPPGLLGRTWDGDLLILVCVRVKLINLFFVIAGLGEGVDGVGRRKGHVLVRVVGHRGRTRAWRGRGEEGREEGIRGGREGGRGRAFNGPQAGRPFVIFTADARKHQTSDHDHTQGLRRVDSGSLFIMRGGTIFLRTRVVRYT